MKMHEVIVKTEYKIRGTRNDIRRIIKHLTNLTEYEEVTSFFIDEYWQ